MEREAAWNGGSGSGPKYGVQLPKGPPGSKIQKGSKLKPAPAAKAPSGQGKSSKASGGMKFGKKQSPREVVTPS